MKNVKVARLISGGYIIGQLESDKIINTKEVRIAQDIARGTNGQPIMNAQNQPQMTLQVGIGPIDLLNPTAMPEIDEKHVLFYVDEIPEELLSRYTQIITGIINPQPEIKIVKR